MSKQETMDVDAYRRAQGLPVKHAAPKRKAKVKPPKEYKLTTLERKFQLMLSGMPQPEREYRFHPVRKWRFDFAWPAQKLAVEVDGGAFSKGGHSRAIPQAGDNDKTNAAILLGWRVLKFNTENMKRPMEIREILNQALTAETTP